MLSNLWKISDWITTFIHTTLRYKVESREHSVKILACVTALPTVSRKIWRSNHIHRIVSAFSKGSPSHTAVVLIGASPSSAYNLIKRVYMNPLGRWPFLPFEYWASSMETVCVRASMCVKTEEKKCIPSNWFHYAMPGNNKRKQQSFSIR